MAYSVSGFENKEAALFERFSVIEDKSTDVTDLIYNTVNNNVCRRSESVTQWMKKF